MIVLPSIERFTHPKQWLDGRSQSKQKQKVAFGVRFAIPEVELPAFVRHASEAMRYYHFLRDIRWDQLPVRTPTPEHLQNPIPYTTFVSACLIKLDQGYRHMPQLHRYLVGHPALIWLLGFALVPDAKAPWGFDAEASLPTARHFTRLLRKMPNAVGQFVLDETVRLLQTELQSDAPDFGQAISLDTKHILAWVKENNPKEYIPDRHDPDKQPAGDPDCKLGCKRRQNQKTEVDPPSETPLTDPIAANSIDVGEYYWGYASGVVATKVPHWGEFVLAELTQTLDRPDVSYFFPLMADAERRLGFRPHFGAFDAAFDAFYVYVHFYQEDHSWQEGFAAVPFSNRNPRRKTFSEDGHPQCEAGLTMTLKYTFMNRTSLVQHERGHYICPIFGQAGASCPIQDKRWAKGGCTHRMPTSPGARIRHEIDRDSDLYKSIYKQRTATERVNSQAVELGIERPRLRNQHAIANQNTLIYVLINLRGLQRIRQRKAYLYSKQSSLIA